VRRQAIEAIPVATGVPITPQQQADLHDWLYDFLVAFSASGNDSLAAEFYLREGINNPRALQGMQATLEHWGIPQGDPPLALFKAMHRAVIDAQGYEYRFGHAFFRHSTFKVFEMQGRYEHYRAYPPDVVKARFKLQKEVASALRAGERPKIEPINDRFRIANGYIETTRDDVFAERPAAIMELFVLMANRRDIAGVRAATIRLIREHLHLIDDGFRHDAQVTGYFLALLRAPHTLVSQLTRMRRYGVLGRYIPEFGRVIGQMQHDLFHIYTVDAHTMMVIRQMRRFRYRSAQEKFPVASQIVRSLPKIELLYVAGLFHDIGKGRGGDHSRLGASDAVRFCRRHGMDDADTDLVEWLVREHLVMSATAQRKDIADPEVINDFARQVGSQARLDYLYALTVADINATNPNLWNSWKATLMRQLYYGTRQALRRGKAVMAVPGSVRNPAAAGTNFLLSEGCAPACCVEDVLTAVHLATESQNFMVTAADTGARHAGSRERSRTGGDLRGVSEHAESPVHASVAAATSDGDPCEAPHLVARSGRNGAPETLSATCGQVHQCLDDGPVGLDRLVIMAGLPPPQVLMACEELERHGLLKREGGRVMRA